MKTIGVREIKDPKDLLNFAVYDLITDENIGFFASKNEASKQCILLAHGKSDILIEINSLSELYAKYYEYLMDHITEYDCIPVEFAVDNSFDLTGVDPYRCSLDDEDIVLDAQWCQETAAMFGL